LSTVKRLKCPFIRWDTSGCLISSRAGGEDQFFRLGVFQIHLPPLQHRREEVPALAAHFLRLTSFPEVADTYRADEVLDELRSRHWTGNLRELRTAIEHAAIVARRRTIRPEHLLSVPTKTARFPAGPEIQGQLTT
jgi:DNA-binding NtrC family response regulator